MADNNEFTLLGTNQLDIDAVSDYVVASKHLVYRNDNASSKSADVDQVGGINANLIAIASKESDRHTVDNALKLAGIPASGYMTTQSGGSLTAKTTNMEAKYQAELADLKDELYQMKNQLAKGGFVRNDGQYAGFHDLFRSNHVVHEAADEDHLICKASTSALSGTANNQVQVLSSAALSKLSVYDFLGIKNSRGKFCVRQITDIKGEILTFDADFDAAFKDTSYELYKSAGIVYDGMFKFANPPSDSLGSNNFYSGVSDDSFNIYKNLQTPNAGFAYSFKIPDGKNGFLSDIEVCLKAENNPGKLMCYVIDERDIASFTTPAMAEAAYKTALKNNNDSWHFFAKSNPLSLLASEGKRYAKFDFIKNDNTYPLLPTPNEGQIIRYVMIVELQSGDANNCYHQLFLCHRDANGKDTDLQLNNTTYFYQRATEDSGVGTALTTNDTINNYDMFYQIHTIENNQNAPTPNTEGLYSAVFYNQQAQNASKARVTLRIKREGSYNAKPEKSPTVIKTESLLVSDVSTSKNGVHTIEDLSIIGNISKPVDARVSNVVSETLPVAIGENIVTVSGKSNQTVTLGVPALIFADDPIYRIAYHVAIKAYNLTFDKVTGQSNYNTMTPVRFNLPLTRIIKDVDRDDTMTSDRIIFEADLPKSVLSDGTIEAGSFNYFEVQIVWENKQLSSYPEVANVQMGAIKELTVSLDRTI